MKTTISRTVLLCCILVRPCQTENKEEKKDIHLMGFLPMTGTIWPGGRALVPALEMALRDVNARQDVLPGYHLNVTRKDTQCDPGLGTTTLFELLQTPPIKHMILGPICSDVAITQAQASHRFNISHLTFAAGSPVLSDRKRFPKFFRISTPETASNLLRIALFKHFNWKKIATMTIADSYFSAVANDLVEKLKETDINIITQEIYLRDPTLRIQNLKNKDARIIYSGSYEGTARIILCEAYRIGLYGQKIVWMFPGWFFEHWWRLNLDNIPCTVEEMDIVAEGHFLIDSYDKKLNDESGIANITPSEFRALYTKEPTYTPETKMYENMNTRAYDAVWVCALALNCTDTVMKERGYNKTLDQFDYSDGDIGDIMAACIQSVNFEGLTGAVRFTESGERLSYFKIVQIQDTYKKLVGIYFMDGDYAETGRLEWTNGGIRWAGGVPPRDSTQITMVEKSISVYLYLAMSASATLGNLLAVALLVFNIIYRNHVYVKLSSPSINNVLIVGCILSYSSVYLYSYGEASVLLCTLRHFTFTTGFTTAFGAMFSKTWRVYKIFCNKKLQRVKINDFQLIAIVVVMASVMLTILIIWEIVDPLTIRTLNLRNEIYETGNDALAIPFLRECTSSEYYYFIWTICIMEGAMLAFGAFLSFETRKIKIEALNDARQIGLCLYNVIVLSAIVLILSNLLSSQIEIVYGIFSGFVLLGTTTTLLIIFTPKIQSVYYPHNVASEGTQNSLVAGVGKRLESKTCTSTHQSTQQSSAEEC